MIEQELPRLSRIDQLLRAGNYGALEALTLQEMPRHLLSEESLAAARAFRLPSTVIYLATLAVENLPKADPFDYWLGVYQSLNTGVETGSLKSLPSRHPLRVVTKHMLQGSTKNVCKFRQCKGNLAAWTQALELAFDHARFDLVLCMLQSLGMKKLDNLGWLGIAKSLVGRQKLVKEGRAAANLGRAYLLIREQLCASQAALLRVRSSLSLHASESFLLGREYGRTLEAARLAKDPEDRARSVFLSAKAHCHLGNFVSAIEGLDRLIELAVGEDTEVQFAPTAEFVSTDAARALIDLQAALSEIGHKAFLVSGTLLGFAREGKILEHDKDIDVGVIGWERQFDIAQAILRSGKFSFDPRRLRAGKAYHLVVQHMKTRVGIDIFLYHRKGEKLVTGVEANFGYTQNFAFTPFELKEVTFLGVDFFVPSNVELNLAENFGDWRESDPDYISHLQSPSTVDVGGLVFQIVGRLRALEAIQAGKHERLSRIVGIMTQHQKREGGMSEAILALLSAEVEKHRLAPAAELRGGHHV